MDLGYPHIPGFLSSISWNHRQMEGQETVMPMVKGTPTRSILPQARSHFSPAGIPACWIFDDEILIVFSQQMSVAVT